MEKRIIQKSSADIVLIYSDTVIIDTAQAALDFLASVYYNDNCTRIAINKEAFCDDFLVLSTGVAGEILQKVINYKMKLAIIGEFSLYTSKALKDFIYECNNGKDVFFVGDTETAIEKLEKAR